MDPHPAQPSNIVELAAQAGQEAGMSVAGANQVKHRGFARGDQGEHALRHLLAPSLGVPPLETRVRPQQERGPGGARLPGDGLRCFGGTVPQESLAPQVEVPRAERYGLLGIAPRALRCPLQVGRCGALWALHPSRWR